MCGFMTIQPRTLPQMEASGAQRVAGSETIDGEPGVFVLGAPAIWVLPALGWLSLTRLTGTRNHRKGGQCTIL